MPRVMVFSCVPRRRHCVNHTCIMISTWMSRGKFLHQAFSDWTGIAKSPVPTRSGNNIEDIPVSCHQFRSVSGSSEYLLKEARA